MITIVVPATVLRTDTAELKLSDIEQHAAVRRVASHTAGPTPMGWTSAIIEVTGPALRYILDALKEILLKSDAVGKAVDGRLGKQKIDFKCGDVSLSVEGADFENMDALLNRVTALCANLKK